MQGTQWYVNDGNGPQGPLEESQIVGLLSVGRIRPTAVFAPSGSQQWLRLDQVPAFHRASTQGMPGGPQAAPGMMPPGPVHPGMMPPGALPHRPAPPRAKSSPVGGIVVAVLVCLGLAGLFGFRYLGARGYASRPEVEATVEKGKLSKDGKSFSVTINVKNEVKGKVDVTAYGGANPLKRLDLSDLEEGAVKAKFDVAGLPAGDTELKLTVMADGYMANTRLVTTVTMPARIVTSGSRLWVDGRRASVELSDGSLKVNGDKGTKVTVGKKELTATGTESTAPFDVAPLLEKTDLAKLSGASFNAPVTFAFADGFKLSGELPVTAFEAQKALHKTLIEVKKGPVVFGKGDDAPPKPRVLADLSGTSLKLHGSGTGPKSIDLVADAEYVTRTSSCGTYRNSVTGEMVSISREMNDKRYTVYERRTGKVVGKRLFSAPLPACPEVMNKDETVSSFPDDGPIDTYLASLAGK